MKAKIRERLCWLPEGVSGVPKQSATKKPSQGHQEFSSKLTSAQSNLPENVHIFLRHHGMASFQLGITQLQRKGQVITQKPVHGWNCNRFGSKDDITL